MQEKLDFEDVIKNLFTDKYSKKEKLEVLAKLENERKLDDYIKRLQPDYYCECVINGYIELSGTQKFLIIEKLGW